MSAEVGEMTVFRFNSVMQPVQGYASVEQVLWASTLR